MFLLTWFTYDGYTTKKYFSLLFKIGHGNLIVKKFSFKAKSGEKSAETNTSNRLASSLVTSPNSCTGVLIPWVEDRLGVPTDGGKTLGVGARFF
jgi:hypothetical protein